MKTIAVCAAQVPFFSGGAETHVSGLIAQLKKRDYEVELINLPYKWYPHEQLINSIRMWELLDLSESNGKKIDLVIATKFPSYFVRHKNKVLWLIHQYRQMYDLMDTPYSGFDRNNRKEMKLREDLIKKDTEVLRSYKRIYTNSANTASRLKKFNSIDSTPLYHPPKLARRYHSAQYQDYVLSVGRLDPLKRVDLLIKALKFCSPNLRCKIAGTGPELQSLKRLSQDAGVSDRIEFLGFIEEDRLLDLYANCSAVYFAPQDEDYGYITLEAFLSKKPVLTAFDSGGPLEFVINGSTGIVFKTLDVERIGRSIEALVSDKNLCRIYGEKGFERVRGIDWDTVIDTLLFGRTAGGST